MVLALYANHQFLSSVRDEATVSVACKFAENGRNVHVISLKSSADWVSKIIYYVRCFFEGYSQMELSLQRELCRREFNVVDLADVHREQRVLELKREEISLQGKKQEISSEISFLKELKEACARDLALLNENLSGAKSQLDSILTEISKGDEKLFEQQKLIVEKEGLEKAIQVAEEKLSSLDEAHWEEINKILNGSNSVEYLKMLERRMDELEKKLEGKFLNSYEFSHRVYPSLEKYQLLQKDYVEPVKKVLSALGSGVTNSVKKSALLKEVGAISVHPEMSCGGMTHSGPDCCKEKREDVVKMLRQSIELSWRFHLVNHTND